jgi:hypothetical protein
MYDIALCTLHYAGDARSIGTHHGRAFMWHLCGTDILALLPALFRRTGRFAR